MPALPAQGSTAWYTHYSALHDRANGSTLVASTDATIRAAANTLSSAGGGTVFIPSGTITLASPLPVLSGVSYVGVPPVQTQSVTATGSYLADSAPTYSGGTVLQGNGTFAAFDANSTDLASPGANVGTTQISNFGLYGMALDNFTYGVRIGARNIMGIVWSKIDQLYLKNCSQWGIYLANFVHCDIGVVVDHLCQNGQYYGSRMDATTYQGGNSVFRELYHLTPQDARDRRKTRGIVFEAQGGTSTNGGALNELEVHRLEVNNYNMPLLTATATLTSGTSAITVPDGTQFLAGMVATFTTTNFGFEAGVGYVVQAVSGNTITLGPSRNGTAITPSGSGTLSLKTYGFPAVEVTAADTNSHVTATFLNHLDIEGSASVTVYTENAVESQFTISKTTSTTPLLDFMSRNSTFCVFRATPAVITDFDAASTTSAFYGPRSAAFQRIIRGQVLDTTRNVAGMQIGKGGNGQTLPDIESRQFGMLYPTSGMGDRIYPRDAALTLSGAHVGTIVFAASSSQTWTLPIIVDDSPDAGASPLGAVYDINNVGSGTITINTQSSQLMNKVTGRTSTTITPGNRLRLVAAKDGSANLFWLAQPSTLLA